MVPAGDNVTVTFARNDVAMLFDPAPQLLDRMHQLLERNTDGALSESERLEVETLVQVVQVCQIMRLAAERKPDSYPQP